MEVVKDQTRVSIAVVHKNVADDFAKFAAYNHGCLPVLVRTEPGNRSFKLGDPDLTRHISPYRTYRNGKEEIMGPVSDDEWNDMVTFYIGCSFAFDETFMKYKIPFRHVEQDVCISVYTTRIPCHTVGVFKANMVVSMRSIPEHQLSLAANITLQMPDQHGAPIHIGNPDVIIDSEECINDPDFHSELKIQDGDVPVFWACGIALFESLKNSNQPLAICQSPGIMDVSGVRAPQEEYNENKPDIEKCQVVKYSDKGQRYSILSVQSEKVLTELENAILDEPVGDHGNEHLSKPGDFLKAALALSHAHSVAFFTGLQCLDNLPNDGTDALPGVYSLAAMLQALGKEVTLIVDGNRFEMNAQLMKKQVDAGILQKEIKLIPFVDEKGSRHTLINNDRKPKYDVMLATTVVDGLFNEATERKDIITIGICDGGKKLISQGDIAKCDVAADLLISAATLNWSCYGLAFALYELRRCQIHDCYYRRATELPTDVETKLAWALPSAERESKNLEVVESFVIHEKKSQKQMSVGGRLFGPLPQKKISQMRKKIGV